MSHQQRAPPRRQAIETNIYATAVGLPEETRIAAIQTLNQVLADTTDLHSQVKFAHWNVKGFDFYQLHTLFDEIAEVLSAHVDRIAERVTALGGQAMGTTRIAAQTSRIPEPPVNAVSEDEYLEWLTDHLGQHANFLRAAVEQATDFGDMDTADLLSDISLQVDQQLYFLESHLQVDTQTRVPATVGQAGGSQTTGMTPIQFTPREEAQSTGGSQVVASHGGAQGGASAEFGGPQQSPQSASAGPADGQPITASAEMGPETGVPQAIGQPGGEQGMAQTATQPSIPPEHPPQSLEPQPNPPQQPTDTPQPRGQPMNAPQSGRQPASVPDERQSQPPAQQRSQFVGEPQFHRQRANFPGNNRSMEPAQTELPPNAPSVSRAEQTPVPPEPQFHAGAPAHEPAASGLGQPQSGFQQ